MYLNKNFVRVFVVLISWALVLQTAPPALAADPTVDSKHFKSLPSDTFGVLHIKDVPKTISGLKQSVLLKA
ncbi:MAG: hypothetical protein KAX38_03455, partial [Candidatus Krumholzibacteria bacterium]|nr:hypothetical protein [Candidatus Krumholzibacteria bacterium]